MEALARWTRRDGETVPPARFIPLAEETGLIVRLGQQQLANACREVLAAEGGEGADGEGVRLHVNLSARQLVDPNVVGRVREVLQSTGFPAGRLTLEITETAAMREPGAVGELRKLGAGIAIDDFGTEHSSLAQMEALREAGCWLAQGFLLSEPMGPEGLDGLLS